MRVCATVLLTLLSTLPSTKGQVYSELVVWGDLNNGGSFGPGLELAGANVTEIYATEKAFAALTDTGLVKVARETRLVEGQTRVFAIGDITSPGLMEAPFNSGYVVQQESKKLAKNILASIDGKPLKPMGKAPMRRGAMLSLGKGHGAGHFDNIVLPQFVVAMMKSGDLFRKKSIKAMNA